jgi:hypothetical protein
MATKKAKSQAAAPRERTRGKNETVALTVRVPREDWVRLHDLAIRLGQPLQRLAIDGLNRIFAENGKPGIRL